MTAFVFLSLGCILEAIAAPIESAIMKPRPKVYRKPDKTERRFVNAHHPLLLSAARRCTR